MCNLYEPVQLEMFPLEWERYDQTLKPYSKFVGPRQGGPFLLTDQLIVGQWGMIRPNSPTRIQRAAPQKAGRLGKILSTNNARSDRMATAATYRDAWKAGRRCLIPAIAYHYPYWGTGQNIWWRFARKDGTPWMLAGLWSIWTDPATGDPVPNYTMITQNANAHPLLRLMHQDERDAGGNVLPLEKQDKRSVVPLEPADLEKWLTGSLADALDLIKLPDLKLFDHHAADPSKQVELRIEA